VVLEADIKMLGKRRGKIGKGRVEESVEAQRYISISEVRKIGSKKEKCKKG